MTARRALHLALLALAGCAATPAARADLAWQHVRGESDALLRDGATVWRFHDGDARSKPCFHPLALPAVGALTVDRPADHVWHHGRCATQGSVRYRCRGGAARADVADGRCRPGRGG